MKLSPCFVSTVAHVTRLREGRLFPHRGTRRPFRSGRPLAAAFLVLAAALLVPWARAEAWPQGPLRIVVTSTPGGGPDLVARLLGERLGVLLGQSVAVENRPGANGNLAAESVVRAVPDAHTLLLSGESLFAVNPHLYPDAGFDAARDLEPVAGLAEHSFVLTVNPKLPVRTLAEFIAYARRASPPLHYASSGHGSPHHLAMERLLRLADIRMVQVPYRGGAPASAAIASGEVAAGFAGTSNAGLIAAGRLRPIAVTSAARDPEFPDVPAIAERYPGFRLTNWYGLFAPRHSPKAALAQLGAGVAAMLADPGVRSQLRQAGGLRPMAAGPDALAARIASDRAAYGELIRELGVRAQ
jgi:tripartite-type tricarboxylate transporter receptor subunit TctC